VADRLKHTHLVLTIAWLAMVPISLITGWISSIVFIAACSIYANAASHASAWQASRAETNGEDG
jgi:ABC-type Mn2+/Zn2+ transport system permease subunit